MINVGSLTGQLSMTFVEKYIGFWCAFLLPTLMFCFCPLVLWFCRHRYHTSPPTGSVLIRAIRLTHLAARGKWSLNPLQTRRNFKSKRFWEDVKPSRRRNHKPEWMKFDDAWVDQVARGLRACSCFTWIPLYCELEPFLSFFFFSKSFYVFGLSFLLFQWEGKLSLVVSYL